VGRADVGNGRCRAGTIRSEGPRGICANVVLLGVNQPRDRVRKRAWTRNAADLGRGQPANCTWMGWGALHPWWRISDQGCAYSLSTYAPKAAAAGKAMPLGAQGQRVRSAPGQPGTHAPGQTRPVRDATPPDCSKVDTTAEDGAIRLALREPSRDQREQALLRRIRKSRDIPERPLRAASVRDGGGERVSVAEAVCAGRVRVRCDRGL
jgi:hypothetical protein